MPTGRRPCRNAGLCGQELCDGLGAAYHHLILLPHLQSTRRAHTTACLSSCLWPGWEPGLHTHATACCSIEGGGCSALQHMHGHLLHAMHAGAGLSNIKPFAGPRPKYKCWPTSAWPPGCAAGKQAHSMHAMRATAWPWLEAAWPDRPSTYPF
jgi:hypothetical protein